MYLQVDMYESVGPNFEVYIDMTIFEVAHVLFCNCLFLLPTILKSKLIIVATLLQLSNVAFDLLNCSLDWFFDLVVVNLVDNLFLCTFDLETTHYVHFLRLVLFFVLLVLVPTFWTIMMPHYLLFAKIGLNLRTSLIHVMGGLV